MSTANLSYRSQYNRSILHLRNLPCQNSFPRSISDRICTHMNEDHASAVVLYAQAFGGQPEATEAQMLAIDANGMDLTAQVNGETLPVRVNFDRTLTDAEDAHHTLIEMVKQARKVAK
ncbi:DUF2470 domain-containing protein [Microcoleus sp. AR_TQ3_B6]|uniref:DUF2470 domain-containing protein n=1 Tax=Microcoleus sp. AR_TQ3_B6 TaxID=3055284 RepID=UPI00403F0480